MGPPVIGHIAQNFGLQFSLLLSESLVFLLPSWFLKLELQLNIFTSRQHKLIGVF